MGRPATLKVDIVTDARKVGAGVSQAESKLGRLGSVGKKVGLAAGAGLALAGAAAVKFGIDSVKAASDVEQSFGGLDAVYGRNAAKVKKWAGQAAESVGLSKSKYAELAAVIGSQLQAMGSSQDQSAKKTKGLISLGSDLAATYGGTVGDAVEAVSSLLKGETDPIERYGVSIKQADINAQMAAMGLDKLTGKAAKQAQQTAVLTLLTKQTSKAHGQFAQQSGTLAEQQQILSAKFENIKATVGKALLPVLSRLFGWVSNKLLPGATKLGRRLSRELGPAFAAVGRFITTKAVPAARSIYAWFVDKIVPGLRRYLTPILRGVRSAWSDVSRAIDKNRPSLQRILSAVRVLVEFFVRHVLPIIGRAAGNAFRMMGKGISGTITVVSRLADGIGWAISQVKSLISWLQNIHVPHISIPHVFGAVGNLTALGPSLVGPSPSYDRTSGWSTASLATAGSNLGGLLQAASNLAPAGGSTYVDARSYTEQVTLQGVIDGDDAARKIEQLLARRGRRLGSR